MPTLSKEEGISFNGFSVDNRNGYYLTNVTMPAKPEQTYTAQYLPGRSETVYGSGGYKDIPITVEVAIRYSDLQDRNNKINAIIFLILLNLVSTDKVTKNFSSNK